ncbi:Cytosolic sulfotransferase 13 [Bienertia sinuspersici]
MYLYQGFWCFESMFEGTISFQTHFQAHDTDIILTSLQKTGTTWLKSLLFSIVNRKNISHVSQHPLRSKNPHELVPQLELDLQPWTQNRYCISNIPSPRLFATHIPYPSLPDSVKNSRCRIVYVCRNPLDTFVSLWHFYLQFEENKNIEPNKEMMEEVFGNYCIRIIY